MRRIVPERKATAKYPCQTGYWTPKLFLRNLNRSRTVKRLPGSSELLEIIGDCVKSLTNPRHIVQELQMENLAATQRIKLLESENQLLSSEAAQLREVQSSITLCSKN